MPLSNGSCCLSVFRNEELQRERERVSFVSEKKEKKKKKKGFLSLKFELRREADLEVVTG